MASRWPTTPGSCAGSPPCTATSPPCSTTAPMFSWRPVQDHISPRLGIRFDVSGEELVVSRPDGQRFLTFPELEAARRRAEQRAEQAEWRAARLAELSRKARRGQATAEELQELDRLE